MNQHFSRKLNVNEEPMEILNLSGGAFNIVTLSKIKGRLDEKIVRQVLDFLQEELCFLNCRIQQIYNRLYFTTSGVEKNCLRVIEHDAKTTYLDTVKEELNQPLSSHKNLIRCLIIYEKKEPNHCYLITTIHHAICDAISCVHLHSEILDCCRKIQQNEPLNHIQTKVLGSLAEFMPQYVLGISANIKALLFIAKTSAQLWLYPPEKIKQEQYLPLKQRQCGTTQRKLDAIITKKLIEVSRQEQTTIHSVICAAMLISVIKQIKKTQNPNKKINVSCRTYVDLRRRIEPSIPFNQLGFLASSITSFHSLNSCPSFWDLAREVSKKNKYELQQKSYFPAFILFRKSLVEYYLKKPDNYPLTIDVSNIGDLKIKKDYGDFQLEEISFIPSNPIFGGILTAAVSTFDDKIILNFVASIPFISQATIEIIANDVIHYLILESKVFNPI